MRTLWAILLGGLAFIGTAEARLGETMEEIEKRLGTLEIRGDKKTLIFYMGLRETREVSTQFISTFTKMILNQLGA